MPPSNDRRQSQDTRRWRRLSNMGQRSTLQSGGDLRYRKVPADSFSSRRSRITGRDRDRDGDGDGGGRQGGGRFREFGDGGRFDDGPGDRGRFDGIRGNDSDSGESSDDDFNNDFSDDDSDTEEIDAPGQNIQPTITSSAPIVTLTALPPSEATPQPDLTTLTPQITNSASPAPTTTPSLPILNPIKLPDNPDTTTSSAIPTTSVTSATSIAISTTTTTPILIFPSDRKEEADQPILSSSITFEIDPTTTPILTASETISSISERPTKDFSMDEKDDDNDGRRYRHGDRDNNNQGGLDSTAEHLLIAAGAIGAFIIFCFIGWIVYRVLKRSKGGNSGMGFIDKLAGRRTAPVEGTLDSQSFYMANEQPPNYEKGEYGMSGNFYASGKPYPPEPGSINRSVVSNSETGTLRQPPNDTLMPSNGTNQYSPENDASSINNNINLTVRSQMTQMSQPYHRESQIPRLQPGNRASQLSSISSGFGDGDIIVPPPVTTDRPQSDASPDTRAIDDAGRDNPAPRDSWVSRDGDRRETVYTTTSEDRPARFRTITSWVNQQAGRAKRAGSRARERGEVPVMPAIPGEINMTRQTAYR